METNAARSARVQQCTLCPLAGLRLGDDPVRLAVPAMARTYYKEGGIVIVFDQPVPDDEQRGLWGHGDTGELMNKLLTAAGIDPLTCAYTSMVHCRPPRGRLQDRPDAVMACRSHLKQDLEDLKPGLVIIMGSAGTKDVLGLKFAVSRDHGTFTVRGPKWDWSSLSPLVMVTYSPAFALFGEGFEGPIGQTIVADLTAARKKWEGIRGVDKSS